MVGPNDEVFHECALRGYRTPPIDLSTHAPALEHAFRPRPNMQPHLASLRGSAFALKFGTSKWLRAARNSGSILVSPASYYERREHNHARRDAELVRKLTPSPRSTAANAYVTARHLTPPAGRVLGNIEIRETCDYYLYSLTASYTSRLFGDFDADACLIIHQPAKFANKLIEALRKHEPDAQCEVGLVRYYDPARIDPALIDVPFYKPFSHLYQAELRLVWTFVDPRPILPRIQLELGSLEDCTELVSL